jgi:phosphomannomutase
MKMPIRELEKLCPPGAESLAELAGRTGVHFGTSGVRGLVRDLTPEVCGAYAHAFLTICGRNGGPVLIGHDLRPSSPMIARACGAEALRLGFSPVFAGVVPTPALAFSAQSRGVPAMMVTGSHIPFDRNGIKFYLPGGEISKEDEQRMLAASVPGTPAPAVELPEPGTGVLDLYVRRYTSAFAPDSLAGMRLGIYEHSSAARDLLHSVFRALGATTVGLGRSDGFVPIDTEAVREEDRALASAWASRHGFDAILTTDGDADRPLIADETGQWLRGDTVGILSARALGARTVVTPVSSNTALEACGAFAETIRTRIGSPYVIAAMEAAARGPVVGYEANGGFLLGTDMVLAGRPLAALRTRDAVLPMILLLTSARAQQCSLSGLVAGLPSRHTFSDRLQGVDVERCRALMERLARAPSGFTGLGSASLPRVVSLDTTDGVRAVLASGDILHLRLSGNAPELRFYAEASTPERSAMLCHDCLARIGPEIGAAAPR